MHQNQQKDSNQNCILSQQNYTLIFTYNIIQFQIMRIICLLWLIVIVFPSQKVPLEEPIPEIFKDETEVITLAKNEQFSLPITTHTITHTLQTIPQNSNQCYFSFESLIYNSQASSSLLAGQDQIMDILPLEKKQKIFLVDKNHNLLTYSLDEHFLLKRLAPKTSIIGSNKKISTIAITATEDQEYVYYLTPTKYFLFQSETLGVEILVEEQLQGDVVDIQKALVHRGYLVLFSSQALLFIYKIDKISKRLALVQRFKPVKNEVYADMQFDKSTEMLYVLSMTTPDVLIYHFEPSEFPSSDKSFKIFAAYDSLNIQNITNKHHSQNEQKNIHFDLAISKQREQQTLMILFLHNYHNVVAEIYYNPIQQNWKFVRYFKFSMRVNQIHIIKDVLLVVGSESMGVFPYGVHPRLIEEELNGLMALTSIFSLEVLEGGNFVGITKNTIQYGSIRLSEKAQLICKISQDSRLKSVKLKANLTACTSQDRILYENYCAYEKIFMIEQMQLTVSAPMANTIWVGMLLFLMAIILGLCILFAMRRRKQSEIRKLEQYFEKKRSEPPQSSDRRAFTDV